MAKDPKRKTKPTGRLSEEERHLWQQVMRDAVPLKRDGSPAKDDLSAVSREQEECLPAATKQRKVTAAAGLPKVGRPDRVAESPELTHGRSQGLDRRQAARFKRGRLPIEGRLDLHGMTQAKAHQALLRFVRSAADDGKRCLLIITGKGRDNPDGGVLRQAVPRWLNEPGLRDVVLTFDYAQQKDGGTGALYLLLKRRRDKGKDPG
ncbi:MAG: Smr/MutS family protein [Kiloniellales bacterium]|nr:Smr/MutS family protein [Kiloniellales bacterium]